MKKKSFLAVLPALLVLSSCSAGPKTNVEPRFVEDTLAHEEVFGALPDFDPNEKLLQPRRAFEGELYAPVLGYQRKTNNDGTYSVRYVAAVNSEWGVENLTWTRSVHDINGAVAKAKTNKAVTTLYDALATDTEPAYATDVEADEDGSKPFNAFAAYCLLNIPADYGNFYVDAYMTVSVGDNTKVSSVGSLNVADSSKTMKYNLGSGNRNIAEINGVLRETDTLKDNNHYNAYSLNLTKNQMIKWYWLDTEHLVYALCRDFELGEDTLDFEINANGYLVAKNAGTYNIYLNSSNKFYIEKELYLQVPSWWSNGDCNPMLQLRDTDKAESDGSAYNSYEMTSLGHTASGELQYYAFVDITTYEMIQFYRHAHDGNYNWGDHNWTGFKSIPSDGKNMWTRPDGDDNGAGSWSVYNG